MKKRKIEFLYTKGVFFQTFCIKLHWLVDSTALILNSSSCATKKNVIFLSEYLRAEHIEQNTTNNKYEHTRIRT